MAIMACANELKIISCKRKKILEDPEEDTRVNTEKEITVVLSAGWLPLIRNGQGSNQSYVLFLLIDNKFPQIQQHKPMST